MSSAAASLPKEISSSATLKYDSYMSDDRREIHASPTMLLIVQLYHVVSSAHRLADLHTFATTFLVFVNGRFVVKFAIVALS